MSLVNIHMILCCLEIKSVELIHIFNSNITRKCNCNIAKTYSFTKFTKGHHIYHSGIFEGSMRPFL